MNIASIMPTGPTLARPDALLLPFRAGRRWVNVQQIIRLEGEGNYTTFFFTDGSRLVVALTLKRLIVRLPASQFVRLHRKHLVNQAFITAIRLNECAADLSNGDAVSISRRRISLMKREGRPLKMNPVS